MDKTTNWCSPDTALSLIAKGSAKCTSEPLGSVNLNYSILVLKGNFVYMVVNDGLSDEHKAVLHCSFCHTNNLNPNERYKSLVRFNQLGYPCIASRIDEFDYKHRKGNVRSHHDVVDNGW